MSKGPSHDDHGSAYHGMPYTGGSMSALDDLIAAAKRMREKYAYMARDLYELPGSISGFDRALSAYEATKAEPVAWLYRYRDGTTYELTAKRQNYAEYKGLTETPLYAHPPAQSKSEIKE